MWDGPARDQAERLNRTHPGWVVRYGTGSRRFFAVAAWPTPEPVMVEDPTAEDLEHRMRQAVLDDVAEKVVALPPEHPKKERGTRT